MEEFHTLPHGALDDGQDGSSDSAGEDHNQTEVNNNDDTFEDENNRNEDEPDVTDDIMSGVDTWAAMLEVITGVGSGMVAMRLVAHPYDFNGTISARTWVFGHWVHGPVKTN